MEPQQSGALLASRALAIVKPLRRAASRGVVWRCYCPAFGRIRMNIKLTIAIIFLIPLSAAAGATPPGLPWINDNYPKALVEGKQRNVPIFVEVWAPW
jgi:hypothetical protein